MRSKTKRVKNKKWLLLLIIAFPSLFWLILETSTIYSNKLPYYGPKVPRENQDTLFYTLNDTLRDLNGNPSVIDKKQFPVYAITFLKEAYRVDAYRLTGLWEYLNYKKSKVEHIPFLVVSAADKGVSATREELEKLAVHKNVHFYHWPAESYEQLIKKVFKEKPYYIDYSFFVLVDANRNIRGYYDGRYVSEIKRLIGEYQHLRLKEEKRKIIKDNEIKSEN